jgi:CBS domain-containing protein
VLEQSSLGDALAAMARRRVRSAVVVATDGTVVGIVEDLTLMRALKEAAAP